MEHDVRAAAFLAGRPVLGAFIHIEDRTGQAGDDTGKQQNGNPIADAHAGDLFAQPHNKYGTSREGGNDDDCRPNRGIGKEPVGSDEHIVAKALEQAQRQGAVPGDGLQFPFSGFAAVPLQPLQGRDGNRQQLNDDGCVDIGLNGQRQHGGGARTSRPT